MGVLRSLVRAFVDEVVGVVLFAIVFVGILAYFAWVPEGHPVLVGLGMLVLAVLGTRLALRWARRQSP